MMAADRTHRTRGRWVLRGAGQSFAAVVALYLVGRGVAEFFIIRYSDPASYRDSWGGPSLAGVFAVHSGPAVLIIAAAMLAIRRRLTARHTTPPGGLAAVR
jgi:hypothetical protein